MTAPAPGSRLARCQDRDPFWTPGQRLAFALACEAAGVEASKGEAERWKRQKGKAFTAWRSISHAERRRRLAEGGAS